MEMKEALEDERIRSQVLELKQTLEQKSYVPKNVEDRIYLRFLHSCYYDLEKARTAADLFFSIRSSSPELLTDRDPLSAPIAKTMEITKFGLYRISGNRNLWIWQLDDPGLQNFNHLLEAKLFILAGDSWLLDDDFLEEEDIVLADAKDMSLWMLSKFSFSVAKKMSKYQQEAIPVRQRQIHVVNAPSVIYRMFALLKPFINKDIMEIIHVHTPNSTTIFEYLSKEDLPEDYGGTRGKISDYTEQTIASIKKNRDILIDENFLRCDKNAKPKNNNQTRPLNVEVTNTPLPSLRNLAID